MTENIEK